MKNKSIGKNNSSGMMGVNWHSPSSRWVARVSIGGKRKTIGYFEDINDAKSARKSAEVDAGYHKNHGRL